VSCGQGNCSLCERKLVQKPDGPYKLYGREGHWDYEVPEAPSAYEAQGRLTTVRGKLRPEGFGGEPHVRLCAGCLRRVLSKEGARWR
jgi:hypothetical protein